jgi:hypothetical protein
MNDTIITEHFFHAEAFALSAELELPLRQKVYPQARVSLCDAKDGGYLSQRVEGFRLEGVISFKSAYTQVAGNRSRKPDHGWTTLATSVVEGLNVLDVLTVDRVVAQVSTDHPEVNGHVPRVTFLGTRFENLRIAGHRIEPRLDLGICGPKPEGDRPYTEDRDFLKRVEKQWRTVHSGRGDTDLGDNYDWDEIDQDQPIRCSLVNNVEEPFPGRCFGHVLDVPDFGRIFLAELTVDNYFELTMIRLDLGCIGHGKAKSGGVKVNGETLP